MYTKRVANYSSFSNFQHSFTIFLHLFLFGLMSYRTWITLLPASAPSLLLRTRSKATTTVALSHFSPAKLFKTGFLNYRRRPESPSSKGCQAFPHFCFLLYNVTVRIMLIFIRRSPSNFQKFDWCKWFCTWKSERAIFRDNDLVCRFAKRSFVAIQATTPAGLCHHALRPTLILSGRNSRCP